MGGGQHIRYGVRPHDDRRHADTFGDGCLPISALDSADYVAADVRRLVLKLEFRRTKHNLDCGLRIVERPHFPPDNEPLYAGCHTPLDSRQTVRPPPKLTVMSLVNQPLTIAGRLFR